MDSAIHPLNNWCKMPVGFLNHIISSLNCFFDQITNVVSLWTGLPSYHKLIRICIFRIFYVTGIAHFLSEIVLHCFAFRYLEDSPQLLPLRNPRLKALLHRSSLCLKETKWRHCWVITNVARVTSFWFQIYFVCLRKTEKISLQTYANVSAFEQASHATCS